MILDTPKTAQETKKQTTFLKRHAVISGQSKLTDQHTWLSCYSHRGLIHAQPKTSDRRFVTLKRNVKQLLNIANENTEYTLRNTVMMQ